MIDFTKEFFKQAWGKDGYYEAFSYGVGIKTVCSKSLIPFFNHYNIALEIGSGGGTFTERMIGNFKKVIAVDVIPMPNKFKGWENFQYIELPNQSNDLSDISNNSIDFCFCYNVFCHLSNDILIGYLNSVNRVLKSNGNFVFMLANYEHTKKNITDYDKYQLGDMTPIGHFYQDYRTIDIVANKDQWEIVNPNMIPEHRDIIVHLKKK